MNRKMLYIARIFTVVFSLIVIVSSLNKMYENGFVLEDYNSLYSSKIIKFYYCPLMIVNEYLHLYQYNNYFIFLRIKSVNCVRRFRVVDTLMSALEVTFVINLVYILISCIQIGYINLRICSVFFIYVFKQSLAFSIPCFMFLIIYELTNINVISVIVSWLMLVLWVDLNKYGIIFLDWKWINTLLYSPNDTMLTDCVINASVIILLILIDKVIYMRKGMYSCEKI